MDNERVSVVVPVYNVEKYLNECVNSILEQRYSNIEVILVNDGSTDASGQICDEYAQKDDRVYVIHQKNSGAATARRAGIIQARGEYICFVDADDRIRPEMIEYFVKYIGESDMITSGCECERRNHETYIRYDAFAPGKYETEIQIKYIISNMITYENKLEDGFLPFLVNKMYRTAIVKDVIDTVDESIVYAEDRDLLFRYILKCKSIVITWEVFYFYRFNQSSIMNRPNKNIMRDLNALYLSLEKAFENHPYEEMLMYQLQLFITSRIYMIPRFMHFPNEMQTIQYVFPYPNLLAGKRFVLYGAGRVGMDYYRQIRNNTEGELVLWIDKQWEKYLDSRFDVKSVEELQDAKFDCVLIAVRRKELADSIKRELLGKGIQEEKIWWKSPIVWNC